MRPEPTSRPEALIAPWERAERGAVRDLHADRDGQAGSRAGPAETVAANIAAQVCGTTVNAAAISDQLARTGSFAWEGATRFVRIKQRK